MGETARREKNRGCLLVLDEIQKVSGWSETVKALWDEDARHGRIIHVLLLGSSSLLIQKGLSESLLNELQGPPYELYYWRQGDYEVDFILHTPRQTWAIEVKSTRVKNARGLRKFLDLYPQVKPVIVGGSGMPKKEISR